MRASKNGVKLESCVWYRLKDFVKFVSRKKSRVLVYHKGFEEGNFEEWNAS